MAFLALASILVGLGMVFSALNNQSFANYFKQVLKLE